MSVTPNKSANKKVTFKSNKKSVATVSSKGVVKGKKTGTAKITVTSKKNKKEKTTVTVKVVKGAVKKVKLNKKRAALNVGQTLSLKKTISASKGASKRVYWTSSRSRVASVSQRGVVTAKAAGTATITAKATDGSNKKATCKVTVSQPVVTTSIIGMKVMSNYSISFTLDRPCALDTNSVVVKKKRYANGPYHYTMKVDSIQTSDMVNYIVSFNDESISEGYYVQLSIPGLNGVNAIETMYVEQPTAYTSQEIFTGTVGKKMSTSVYFSGAKGYSSYNVTGLPGGLTYTVEDNEVIIKGTPTAPQTAIATVTAVDEFGNTMNKTCIFCIGSPSAISGAMTDSYGIIGSSGYSFEKSISVTGGSGSYNYTMLPNTAGLTVSSGGYVEGNIHVEGTYNVTVQVTDALNPAIATNVPITIYAVQGHTVKGMITDAQGNFVTSNSSANVYFENTDKNDKYYSSSSTYTDSNGTYTLTLPTGYYDICVEDNYTDSVVNHYNYPITGSVNMPNIALPIYKVALVPADGVTSLSGKYWYDENDESVGYGDVVYAKAGTHTITSESSAANSLKGTSRYTATFTVVNTAIQVAVTSEVVGAPAPTTAVTIPGSFTATISDGEIMFFSFVAPETATYKFYSADASGKDTYGYFYDSNKNLVTSNDDGNGNRQFLITRALTAGQTYYFGAKYLSSGTSGSYPVIVEKVVS